ncbi:hypothetical protein B9G98_04400 [Wickerhamiella sorbophila]|uniref:DNA mismatch repair protein HSM3 N-terminal domain-containing protein n=1 Tax=Wickerhamiella sorbophila TaxID=45607 RepID=A0A2T0FP67_9ASCO|nr:hypothetical protein B9G98_04400 [Wickerhamiella sorbophila]PRT56780.1 hypothetical protein B9G98_04400 [Wickerhamiella sorbophila]
MPNVDEESLNSLLARLTSYPEERHAAAKQYMPAILDLVSSDPSGVDAVPEGLVPILLEECSLQEVLQFIPPQMFELGLQMPTLQGGLLDQLAKAASPDLENIEITNLIQAALFLLTDPSFHSVGKVEKLAERLNQLKVLQDFIPFEPLFSGGSVLQSRLMALNILLTRSGNLKTEFAIWPLKSADVLDSLVRAEYYANLIQASPPVVHLLDGVLHDAAKLFKSQIEPLLTNPLEQIFVNLARADPQAFSDLDKRYKITDVDTVTLLARLPPVYIRTYHSDLPGQLVLSSRTVPAFCNLATDDSLFDLLQFTSSQLSGLSLDMRLPLMIACTNDRKTAQRFVGRFHRTMQGVLEPSGVPDIAAMQNQLEFNLRKAGISLGFTRVTDSTK